MVTRSFSRLLLLLALSAGMPSRAQAANDAWTEFAQSCESAKIPGFEKFVKEARSWELAANTAEASLSKLANETCPRYLQSANGEVLGKFAIEQAATYQSAIDATRAGEKHVQFLKAHYDRLRATDPKFAGGACGQYFRERYRVAGLELKELGTGTSTVNEKCSALAAKLTEEGLKENTARALEQPKALGSGFARPPESKVTGELHADMFGDGSGRWHNFRNPTHQGDAEIDVSKVGNISELEGRGIAGAAGTAGAAAGGAQAEAGKEARSPASEAGGLLGIEAGSMVPPGALEEALAKRRIQPHESAAPFEAGRPQLVLKQNEDSKRFLEDIQAGGGNSAPASPLAEGKERTIFEIVTHRYRILTPGLR